MGDDVSDELALGYSEVRQHSLLGEYINQGLAIDGAVGKKICPCREG